MGLTNSDISGILEDFSFTDGRNPALTLANTGDLFDFTVSTDGLGNISAWSTILQPKPFATLATNEFGYTIQTTTGGDFGASFVCLFNGGGGCGPFISEFASNISAGTWNSDTAPSVPEPSSLALTALALASLRLQRRRKSERNH